MHACDVDIFGALAAKQLYGLCHSADKKDKLTKMMDLEDISEDYEKDFWK